MHDTVIMITGTRKGIGRYMAEQYLERGAVVIGCSRSESDLEHAAYHHFCLDISDESSVKKMFAAVRKTFGGLDILINNAGIASMNHVLLTPVDTVRKIMETNVIGTFLFSREAAKLMKKKKAGNIVNFSSLAVPLKLEGECAYAASKAAVVMLTQVMAKEFADYGIRVNCVGPPPVATDLVRNVPSKNLENLIARQVVKRFATKEEVLQAVDYFLDPKGGMITGQVIYLGGVS